MSDESFEVNLKCLFCDSELKVDTNKNFASGDMLICQNCGEGNDFDSLIEVAKEEGIALAKQQLNSLIKNKFKKSKLFK